MKFNKWTLGLAAIGVVSMASAVRAQEAKLVPLNTALSSTTISGYADVAVQYNPGNYSTAAGVPAGTSASKVDNFSLNNLNITLDKPEDESPWAAGYHAELNFGNDAVGLGLNGGQGTQPTGTAGTGGSLVVRQGYAVVRTPIGNGIDWKFGVQDDVIGYEGNTDASNPNYTRSIGYSVEPTTLLGLVGSYKIIDAITVQAGLADATSPTGVYVPATTSTVYVGGNKRVVTTPGYWASSTDRWSASSSDKTIVAAVAFTAPESFGFAKGATLNLGTLLNVDKGGQDNYYVGLTVPTPWSALKVGAAFDYVSFNNAVSNPNTAGATWNSLNDSGWVLGVYASIQATDKLSFNVRGEYYDMQGSPTTAGTLYANTDGKGEELTATVSYSLWANVTSRLEFRWDHLDQGTAFSNSGGNADAFLVAANFIYTF